MKKIFAFVLVFAIAIAVMGAGTTVLDLRKTVGATGVLFADTLKGVFVGAINSATSDITVDDITCNTITADTIAGGLVTGDLTIGAGYELNCDSAVIDTLATSIGAIASLTSSTLITSAKDSTIVLKVMSGMTLADTIRILDVDTFGTDKTCDTFVNTKIATGAFAYVTWKTQPDSATAVSAICLTDSLFVTVNKAETGGIYQFMIVNP